MSKMARVYIGGVIGTGASVLAASLMICSWPNRSAWEVYAILAVMASVVKLRLPGVDGTYSMGSLFVLYGVVHFDLAEVLVAACAGAMASSLFNNRKRPSSIQVLFNIAGVAVSAGVCFLVGRVWLAPGIDRYRPAVVAAAACAYFVVNTVLVSGVLSLLEGKRLAQICSQWYVWAFPYYLIGVALVGLMPSGGHTLPGEAWLIVFPLVYLIHFFLGLVQRHVSARQLGDQENAGMPLGAVVYIVAVVAAGVVLLTTALLRWRPENLSEFACFLVLAMAASTLKIRLPRVQGTISPAFVLVLVTIAQLSFAETVVMAIVSGAVQVLWRPARRPILAQIVFNPSSLAVSAAAAYALTRGVLAPWLDGSVAGVSAVSTVALYLSNTFLTATVIAFIHRRPLRTIWQLSYFWSLPYYLVGAAVAGAMTAINQTAGWPPSLLLLPLMGLVYISYRVHVMQAIERKALVEA
ncbi:MAG TPA: hypothetical protein VMB03_02430 [Bryobacteraceae bacterium]|nr:hypothetical protein [Bryobacteraceae bacterium]